jgi:hypothetical protein
MGLFHQPQRKKSVVKEVASSVLVGLATVTVALGAVALGAGLALGVILLGTCITTGLIWVLNFALAKAFAVAMWSLKKDFFIAVAFSVFRSLYRSVFVRAKS